MPFPGCAHVGLPHVFTQHHFRRGALRRQHCSIYRSVSTTLRIVTHPTPIMHFQHVKVHPWKTETINGSALWKRNVLFFFIFKTCGVKRKCTTITGCGCWRSYNYWAGLTVVIPWVLGFLFINATMCGRCTREKQATRTSYSLTIHNTAYMCRLLNVCVCANLVHNLLLLLLLVMLWKKANVTLVKETTTHNSPLDLCCVENNPWDVCSGLGRRCFV